MEGRALKEILKPTTGKLVMFLVLMLLVVILPLYPTHYDATSKWYSDVTYTYSSGTSLEPLVFVITYDYSWTIREDNPLSTVIDGQWLYTDYDYSADPVFLALYIPYAIVAYVIGCFLVQYLAWWRNKNKNIKQIKDFY